MGQARLAGAGQSETSSDPDSAIAAKALRLLAMREHSRLELLHKLTARGFAEPAVILVLDRLTRDGSLNEGRMAAAYVAERARKGFGPVRIRQELRERGLSRDCIDPHLAEMEGDWLRLLEDVHDRHFGRARAETPAEAARRARFLEQRGFPADMIRRLLRRDA